MENNKYIIRKYDERRHGIYDTENNEFIQIGLLTDIQEALKEYENKDQNSEKERNEEKVEENKTIKTEATGTDVAAQAIMKYSNDGKTLDQEWLNNDIQLYLRNERPFYDAMVNTRRPAHSVAYDGLMYAINSTAKFNEIIDRDLTSRQIQAGFKKLGLDFKEVIKPSVEFVEEERAELKEENKEVKTEGVNPNQEIIDAVELVKKDSLESGMYGEDEFILQCYDAYRDITNKLDISKEVKNEIKEYAKQVYKSLNESKEIKTESISDYRLQIIDIVDKVKEDFQNDKISAEDYEEFYQEAFSIIRGMAEEEGILVENKEVKTEERVNRTLHTGDQFKNANDVIVTITGVDDEHLLDGEPQVTYQFSDSKEYKCFKQSSVNSMLDQNGYKLIENKEIKTEGPEDWKDGLQPQLSDDDEYTFDKESELSDLHDEEDGTVLDELQNRIGVEMNVGELNNMLQTLFGTFNKSYILRSDLYNKDLDANQELVVDDDGDFYVINYDIIDIDTGTIELTDANLD